MPQTALDPIRLADHVEALGPGRDAFAVPGLLCELDAVIGENGVDLVGHGFEHVLQRLPTCLFDSRCNESGNGELDCRVDTDKEVELAFSRLDLGNVDVEEPDGVALEPLPLGRVAFDIQQARDAMPLETLVQRSAH